MVVTSTMLQILIVAVVVWQGLVCGWLTQIPYAVWIIWRTSMILVG
jgi:hypothetical protein